MNGETNKKRKKKKENEFDSHFGSCIWVKKNFIIFQLDFKQTAEAHNFIRF